MTLTNLNLKSFDRIYPILIQKYNTLVEDPNANVLDKINQIIDSLNSMGKLSNDVVNNWNNVMAWTMNDGLTTDVSNKLNTMVADGTFDSIFQKDIAPSLGDLTTLQTTDKSNLTNALNEVDNLAKTNQTNLGTLANLTTSDKTSLVNAVNSNVASLAEKAMQSDLNITNANLGDLTQLNTNDKSSTVNALKEIKTQANNNASAISGISASPKGVYTTLSQLQSAFSTGNSNVYLVTGNVKEVDTLNITAAPTASGNVTVGLNGVNANIAVTIGIAEVDTLTVSAGATTAGNITITLNGVATTVVVASGDTAGAIGDKIRATTFTGWTVGGTAGTSSVTFTKTTVGTNTAPTFAAGSTGSTGSFVVTTSGVNSDTTTTVATKIRGTSFSGWTTGGTGTSVTFTANVAQVNTAPSYSAGSTGTTGTMSVTTAGVNVDGNWYYWNGSAWTVGGIYQGTTWQEGIDARTNSLGIAYPNLKSRLDDLAGIIKNSVSTMPTLTDIVVGSIDATGQDTGVSYSSARTSTIHNIPSGSILTITIPSDFYLDGYAYNSNNVTDFASKVITGAKGTITLTLNYSYFRFRIARNDGALFSNYSTIMPTFVFKLEFINVELKASRGTYATLGDRLNTLVSEDTLASSFIYGEKINNASMNVSNLWINGSGVVTFASGYAYGKIPVTSGETVSISRCDNVTFYNSNTGAISFMDSSGAVLSHVSPENYFNGTYNGYTVVTVQIPTGASYLAITTILGTSWDISNTMVVVYGDTISDDLLANGNIVKLYGHEIRDDEARKSIKTVNQAYIGKKWVYVGDSITENNSYATSHYWSYIQNDLGFTGINMGVSGTGYKRTEDANTAFYQRVSSIDTTADIVTILGSINDAYYSTNGTLGSASDTFTVGGNNTVCACINQTLNNLYSVMPLVKVGLITPLPNFNNYPLQTSSWFENYVNAIVQIGKQRGIPVLDLYHRSLLKPWDSTQNSLFYENDNTKNTHPNANGHKVFYPAIREFIKTLI